MTWSQPEARGRRSPGGGARGGPSAAPLPCPLNQLPLSLLCLPRICILQPTFLTISATPWTSCTERWVEALTSWTRLKHVGGWGKGGWGKEGEIPPPPKETAKGVGAFPFQSLGPTPEETYPIWNQHRRISGLMKRRQLVCSLPPPPPEATAGWLPGEALPAEP